MIEFIGDGLRTILTFYVTINVLVFVHEMGHYLVAQWFRVRVEVFSLGFGRELIGWNDSRGTRWKVAAIPIGGYVKFLGDENAASAPSKDQTGMSPADRGDTLQAKPLHQRTAVVAAGPVANFLLAIILFAGIFSFFGQPFTAPIVNEVIAGSAAEEAGLEPGDRILQVGSATIRRFEDLQRIVQLRPGETLTFQILRGDQEISLVATPSLVVQTDGFGNVIRLGRLGIRSTSVEFVRHDPLTAVWYGARATLDVISTTFVAIRQMIVGTRGTSELAGPIGIAQMTGQVAQLGFLAALQFAAFLSVSLGLINLFPIPILDGGHLLFYSIEALLGRPLSDRAQDFGMRIGLALVLMLFAFSTFNDLSRLNLFGFVSGLFS